MNESIKKREKRYSTDIGKDSDDLVIRLKHLSRSKKINKQQIINRALEFCCSLNLDLSEKPDVPVFKKDIERLKNDIKKMIHGSNDTLGSLVKRIESKKD